jgi:hypothetical protein
MEHAGLSAFLMTLRVRLAALVLLSAGTLLARAFHAAAVVAAALPTWSVIGAALSIVSCWGLGKHVGAMQRGRAAGWISLLLFALSVALDVYALCVRFALVQPTVLAGISFSLGRIVALAELTAFFALAPIAASHADVAAGSGGRDIAQRAGRAMRYVLLVTLIVVGLGWVTATQNVPEPVTLGLAGVSVVLVVLALAKVLGVTRFLLAYLRTLGQAESSTSMELKAWRGA